MQRITLEGLVQKDDYLGSVYHFDYDHALVLTNDHRQVMVGGVAKNCFLTVESRTPDGELDEVILLSVIGPEALLTQRELSSVRESLALEQVEGEVGRPDPKTEARLGTRSLRCNIVGTFYTDEDGRVRFGADVDSVRSVALLKAYRPTGNALSLIASFTNTTVTDGSQLEIGKVRYTETRKKVDEDAAVMMNVTDIIGAKTAVFGLTRAGKSNSIKTILQKVHRYSHDVGEPVAQLILDPQGEYANVNSQDGEAIANIGDESEIAIYKLMDRSSNPKEKFLQFNLFSEDNLALTFELIKAEISAGISGEANYIAPLMAMSFEPLGENAPKSQRIHYARKKLGLFALMYESLGNRNVKPFSIPVGEELASAIAASAKGVTVSTYSNSELSVTNTQAASRIVSELLRENAAGEKTRLSDSWLEEIKEGDAGRFFDQITEIYEKGRNGVKAAISRIEELHSDLADGDVRVNVWDDIQAGKLIVVDLSRGSTKTSQALSELIVNYLLDQASDRFVSGLSPVPFQIVVEEAHNLFERDSRRDERDPWVRISKEAAKYRIGLVYATQEVSSVDQKILSNTHNWLVSQLISSKELHELGNYYGFAEWADHIRKIETKGFTRMKTASSPYIVPVQVELFQARVRSGVSSAPTRPKQEKVTVTPEPKSSLVEDEPFEF